MIDASVLLAIMLNESDADQWVSAIRALDEPFSTAPAIAEVALRLSNLFETPDATIEADITALLSTLGIAVRDLPAASWPIAVRAMSRFGRGRHPARLNFGDCLAYAAARHYGAPLLYKGDDFSLTDVNAPTGTPPR